MRSIYSESSSLSALLTPRSVAVVGASGDPASPFARPVAYLQRHGFPGEVVPVNPKYDRIGDLRCFPELRSVPHPVDLVMLMTPAAHVADTIVQAAEIGARAAVICSSGFAETGPGGGRLQHRLAELSAETGMRVLGPNSQGLIFGPSRLTATFTAGLIGAPPGRGVAYVGQSGAIGGCVLDNARELGLGIAAWVSTGNQVDLDAVEVAGALIRDERIDAVMLYLETVPDGRAYTAMADSALRAGKPVIVLRSGRSDSGRRAGVSHTGAALGPNTALELASARYGVILADDPHELLLMTQAAVHHPRPRGDRIGIVTTSGGAGAVVADHCERRGLRVPALSAALQEELSADLAVFGSAANPVDLTAQVLADASRVGRVCAALARSGEVDAIVFLATMVTGAAERRLATDLAATIARSGLPFLTVWLAGDEQTAAAREILGEAGVPVYRRINDAVGVLSRLCDVVAASCPPSSAPPDPSVPDSSAEQATLPLRPAFTRALASASAETLMEGESLDVLGAFGIPHPEGVLARSADEAARAALRFGERVVMKLQSPAIPHKSDVGGVRVGVPVTAVRAAFEELMALGRALAPGQVRGVLVQALAPPATEVLIGVVASEDGFPPVLSFGLGGTEADLHQERARTLLPVDRRGASELIDGLPAARLLRGFRGRPPADVGALAGVIVAVGELCTELGERLLELEINPLRVYPDGGGALALDFLLRLHPGEPGVPDGSGTPDARHGLGQAEEMDVADAAVRPPPPHPVTNRRRTP
jgi:acyl-CoA synthetase (NDP forming)